METPHSPEMMKESLLRTVVNEYSLFRYPDWPNLMHLTVDRLESIYITYQSIYFLFSRTTYGQLWQGVGESADYMAIVFEEYDGIGAQVPTNSPSSIVHILI